MGLAHWDAWLRGNYIISSLGTSMSYPLLSTGAMVSHRRPPVPLPVKLLIPRGITTVHRDTTTLGSSDRGTGMHVDVWNSSRMWNRSVSEVVGCS
ncbi:hypothetical protein SUGI_1486370 [Cryptomeria japonica]|uniref:Uncharacterized protein n=1 Tax=Cryptomeria japonica TaxID=3369 RepID=A0AAD3NVN2_CRYJA|nr:hypothetical protein SUGI_1486370 [Cryptomeria japonica]